MASSAIS